MSESASLHALVHGYVQGVGFRFFVEDRARELNLTGYVRNLRDRRSLEVVAEGERDKLAALLASLERGPRGARVENVEATWGAFTGTHSRFEIRYW